MPAPCASFELATGSPAIGALLREACSKAVLLVRSFPSLSVPLGPFSPLGARDTEGFLCFGPSDTHNVIFVDDRVIWPAPQAGSPMQAMQAALSRSDEFDSAFALHCRSSKCAVASVPEYMRSLLLHDSESTPKPRASMSWESPLTLAQVMPRLCGSRFRSSCAGFVCCACSTLVLRSNASLSKAWFRLLCSGHPVWPMCRRLIFLQSVKSYASCSVFTLPMRRLGF